MKEVWKLLHSSDLDNESSEVTEIDQDEL